MPLEEFVHSPDTAALVKIKGLVMANKRHPFSNYSVLFNKFNYELIYLSVS